MSRRRAISSAVALFGTLAFAGCGERLSTVPEAPPAEQPIAARDFGPEPPVSLVAVQRGAVSSFEGAPSVALKDVLSRSTAMTDVLAAGIGQAPVDVGIASPWLYVTVRVNSSRASEKMFAQWEAELLLGAVAEASAGTSSLADSIAGLQVEFRLPDGSAELAPPRVLGNMASGQKFVSPGDDASNVKSAEGVLQSFGLTAIDAEILHPLEKALVVTASIPSPEALKGRLRELETALSGTPFAYEGMYLEIRLPTGEPIAKLASSYRTGAGTQWIEDGLEDVLGGTVHQ